MLHTSKSGGESEKLGSWQCRVLHLNCLPSSISSSSYEQDFEESQPVNLLSLLGSKLRLAMAFCSTCPRVCWVSHITLLLSHGVSAILQTQDCTPCTRSRGHTKVQAESATKTTSSFSSLPLLAMTRLTLNEERRTTYCVPPSMIPTC